MQYFDKENPSEIPEIPAEVAVCPICKGKLVIASSLRERDIRITNLERQVSQLTRLIRLLADRAALDLSEGQDDSLAWIQAELRRLEEA